MYCHYCNGKKIFLEWEKFAKPYWVDYCQKYKINLIVFDKLIVKPGDKYFKKLIGKNF